MGNDNIAGVCEIYHHGTGHYDVGPIALFTDNNVVWVCVKYIVIAEKLNEIMAEDTWDLSPSLQVGEQLLSLSE